MRAINDEIIEAHLSSNTPFNVMQDSPNSSEIDEGEQYERVE
jgi:hypothetical protein